MDCRFLFGLFFFLLQSYNSFSQTLPVGTPVEEAWRRQQITGERSSQVSFAIRPIELGEGGYDSAYQVQTSFHYSDEAKATAQRKRPVIRLVPVILKQQYNSHQPYGWNDGSMIPANGYQTQLSFGLFSKIGSLNIQINPELVYAQNKGFHTFPSSHSDSIWKGYYSVLNRIDAPERFGTRPYFKLFPGQSSVRFTYKKFSIGVSTENLWWGPGIRNALLMSNNAPGFGHLSFNTTSPVTTPVGSFEWQVISGLLKNSGLLPPDTARTFQGQKLYSPKLNDERYLNGMVIAWQPKWTPGLHLGFTRVFYQYKSNIPPSLNGYVPVFTSFFKSNSIDEDLFGRDQMLSLFARLLLPESKAEVYAEYGRNDHSGNLTDLILEPEHARAYTLGLRKIFTAKRQRSVEFFMELTQLQLPSTFRLRATPGWYEHHQIRHGYTNVGQVIGAGIGPGSNSQTFGLNWINAGKKMVGVFLERVVHNNDFYYDAFAPLQDYLTHWVDLSLNFNKSWTADRFVYAADLALVKSYNYEWQHGFNFQNVHAVVSVSYLFKWKK